MAIPKMKYGQPVPNTELDYPLTDAETRDWLGEKGWAREIVRRKEIEKLLAKLRAKNGSP